MNGLLASHTKQLQGIRSWPFSLKTTKFLYKHSRCCYKNEATIRGRQRQNYAVPFLQHEFSRILSANGIKGKERDLKRARFQELEKERTHPRRVTDSFIVLVATYENDRQNKTKSIHCSTRARVTRFSKGT